MSTLKIPELNGGLFSGPYDDSTAGEFHACFLKHALDRGEVVAVGRAALSLEVDDDVAGNGSGFCEYSLVHIHQPASSAALCRGYGHDAILPT
jgi:hypothetical protein